MPWAPRWSWPPETMPAPMPVATLMRTRSSTSARWARRSPRAMMLTSLSTRTGTGVVALDVAGHVEAVPAGHDRRVDRAAGGVLDGTGQPDADGGQVGEGSATGAHQVAHRVNDPGQHGLGSVGDQQPGVDLPEDRSVEVGQRGPGVGRADVDPHDQLGRGVEGEQCRRSATGGSGAAEGGDESQLHEGVDPRGDGRPRQSGGLRQLGARPWSSVSEEVEELTGAHT